MQKKITKWLQNSNNDKKQQQSKINQSIDQNKNGIQNVNLVMKASIDEERQFQKDIAMAKSLSRLYSHSHKNIYKNDNNRSTCDLNINTDSLPNINNSLELVIKENEKKSFTDSIHQVDNTVAINIDDDNGIQPLPTIETEYSWDDVEAFVTGVTNSGTNLKPTPKSQVTCQQNNHNKRKIQDRHEHTLIESSVIELDNETNQITHTTKDQVTKSDWHDEDAEDSFFRQFKREIWIKEDIVKEHKEAKKRSMSTVIRKNNKKLRSNMKTQDRSNNYYSTSDEILEGNFEESGFGSSLTSLSYEGIGQARYA
ncbi:hypothetical protein BJ944DRAFT_38144 [Cunninghamella echinulata]|nr:hypothetical protein BJ944DRAFT_38144 [Cunninghamella echinulata]